MRRLPCPGPALLRRAVSLLLALVLALNGLLAPLAMAAPTPAADTAAMEGHCHGMDASATTAGSEQTPDSRHAQPDPQHPQPDCCQQGHCLCACLFSVHIPYSRLPELPPARAVLARGNAQAVTALRLDVPLRPPIA
jgi:hypothetical protein